MSRTLHGRRPAGSSYLSGRGGPKAGVPGRVSKDLAHHRERAAGRRVIAEGVADMMTPSPATEAGLTYVDFYGGDYLDIWGC